MAFLSRTVTPANGAQTAFPVSFPLRNGSLGRTEVDVFVHLTGSGDIGAKKVVGVDFNWTSDGLITFLAGHVPPNYSVVDIRRHTLDAALAHTVQAGGSLKSSELVANDLQLLYLAEEAEDAVQDLQAQTEVNSEAIVLQAARPPLNINGAPYDASAFPLPVVTPEMFAAQKASGVVGDGTDDAPALNAMAAAVNTLGGGTVVFDPQTTYWVGTQMFNAPMPALIGGGVWTFGPKYPYSMEFAGGTRGLRIMGCGSKVKCLPGKKYGSFNEDASARADVAPFFGAGGIVGKNAASPYLIMLYVHNWAGDIDIDIELDGSSTDAVVGGVWGDSGYQLAAYGCYLADNTGSINTRNLNAHHHCLDGLLGAGPSVRNVKESAVIHGRFNYNGRQGLSLVGGNNWHLADGCEFNHTGRGGVISSPGAGIDIEPEFGKLVLDTTAGNIQCIDNQGAAIVTLNFGSSEKFVCHGGTFIGTTNSALWAEGLALKLVDCLVVGPIVNAHADSNEALAFNMTGGKWTDDLTLSPTGQVNGVTSASSFLVVTSGSLKGILFDRVHIRKASLTTDFVVGMYGTPDSTAMRLSNCVIENANAGAGGNLIVYGIYSGEKTHFINASGKPDTDAGVGFLIDVGAAYDSYYFERSLAPSIGAARYGASVDRATGVRLSYGAVVPAAGTWAKGDRRINNDADSGEYIGWICTVAGTPGTWKGYGAIA